MLIRLSVKNFILIEKLDLEFKPGLCAITGETGAGKSILIDALLFCLGGRFNASIIRSGCDSATVTAEFSMNKEIEEVLNLHGIDIEDSLFIKRQQNLKNQKKFFINDIPATPKLLTELTNLLLDYHGQNQHNYLENVESHIKILDSFADNAELLKIVAEKYSSWKNLSRELEQITLKRAQIEGEKSYLKYVVDELTKANIKEGEEEKLSLLRIELQQKAKSEQLVADITALMDGAAFENKIMQMQKILTKISDKPEFNLIIELLDQSLVNYQEAKEQLNNALQNNGTEYTSLEDVEERLFFIKSLSRKYNRSGNELNSLLKESRERLLEISDKLENTESLKIKNDKAKDDYLKSANELSRIRKIAAEKLFVQINKELKSLKMEKAQFTINIDSLTPDEARKNGIDSVRFMASTNPGTPLAPIDKIASGGELSRLMLALKVASYAESKISNPELSPCIIFDEIDTGLGGMVASLVGERLKELAKFSQVVVITHQPQVAGLANQHILVHKIQSKDSTSVNVRTLSIEERQEEIARMLSGKEITETIKKAASELIHS